MGSNLQCPQCSGNKTLVGVFPAYPEGTLPDDRKPVIEIDCPICYGEGRITGQRYENILRGQEIKRLRLSKGIGLRECAQRLLMMPSSLSDAEVGKWPDPRNYETLRVLVSDL